MPSLITAKIDVTKIDKSKLFKGAKGTYLDLVLIPSTNSKYGDTHMVVQGVSKEEREAGVKGAILGNAKESGGPSSYKSAAPASAPAKSTENLDEDVPF